MKFKVNYRINVEFFDGDEFIPYEETREEMFFSNYDNKWDIEQEIRTKLEFELDDEGETYCHLKVKINSYKQIETNDDARREKEPMAFIR